VHYAALGRGLALTTALAVLLLSGCGGDDSGEGAKVAEPAATIPAQSKKCIAGSFHRLGSTKIAYVAVVRSRVLVFHRPGGPRLALFARRNVNRVPTIFSIRGARVDAKCNPRTYLVQVPRRPNGVTGWVSAAKVHVETVRTRLLVDLSDRRVTLFKNGRKVLSSRAAIGSSATPTPVGRFYVNQRLIPYDPNGPFGPGAVGVSAFSEVLTGWTQGGPIAIHGTNAPWSIGKAVSNGCIRLPNPVLRRVFAQALTGTPVVIRR
jgi:lipoprotein-anchoring transpeptidase ErfK/SrfK